MYTSFWVTPRGRLCLLFMISPRPVRRKGPSKAGDDKVDNKRGATSSPSSGGHRLGLLHFLWKTGTGPRGSSCQLCSLTSVASLALVPNSLSLPLSISLSCALILSVSEMKRRPLHNLPPYSTRIPQAKPHQGYCSMSHRGWVSPPPYF